MLRQSNRRGGGVVLWMLSISIAMVGWLPQAVPATDAPTVSFSTLPALQVTTPKPDSAYVPGDFNGDGVSDLLWFNPTLSQLGYWVMTASNGVQKSSIRTYNITSGYFVGAVGDFNNDGYADIVFTSAQHDLWLWTNNQQGGFVSIEIGTYPSNWELVGAGDVDGDGYDDLLWLDPVDCKFAYWTMHGAVRTGYKIINIGCGYYPISIGYYAQSNRISIIWTDASKRGLYIWDSTDLGFYSSDVTWYFDSLGIPVRTIWAIGGGYQGSGMGVQYLSYNDPSIGGGAMFARTFDRNLEKTPLGFITESSWGGVANASASAGYIIEGNSVNATGLYAYYQGSSGLTLSTTGVYDIKNSWLTGNSSPFPGQWNWSFPSGWYVVGAPGNHVIWPSD